MDPRHFATAAFAACLGLAAGTHAHAAPDLLLAQNDAARSEAEAAKPEDRRDAVDSLNEAKKVIGQMEADSRLKKLMQQAKGVFIVPQYTKAGLGIGGEGGAGVMVANNNGEWSSPAFYDLGGISVGAQAGIETGAVAMLLMTEKAVSNFMEKNKFSVDAEAGLTIAKYNAQANIVVGRDDVVMWTDTQGAFIGGTVGASDIRFDDDENAALYQPGVTAADILRGKVSSEEGATLTAALPKPESGSATGASSGGTEQSSGDKPSSTKP